MRECERKLRAEKDKESSFKEAKRKFVIVRNSAIVDIAEVEKRSQ